MTTNQPSILFREILRLKATIRELENARTSEDPEYFVASLRRALFHRPLCEWASNFLDSPNLIEFSSHSGAIAAGYKPCKTCHPPGPEQAPVREGDQDHAVNANRGLPL